MSMIRILLAAAIVLAAAPASASGATTTTDVEVITPGGEPQIAVNPRDPRNVIVGDNVGGVSFSRDGGVTWKHVRIPNIGDNVVTARPDGTFLYSSINGTVWSSRNGGERWEKAGNWVGAVAETGYTLFPDVPYPANVGGGDVVRQVACSAPDVAGAGPTSLSPPPSGPGVQLLGCDRPWLVSDPNTGRAYLSFAHHNDPSGGTGGSDLPPEATAVACRGSTGGRHPAVACGRSYVAASEDGGRTWTDFRPIDSEEWPWAVTNGWSGGPTAAFGTLATAYVSVGQHCSSPCVVFQSSRDDGATWVRHVVAPIRFPDSDNLPTTLNFSPYVAADPSRPGRYAVLFFDAEQKRMYVHVTENSGATWKQATLGEPGDAVNRWTPWIAYGPGGALGAIWRSSYADGSFDAWVAVSRRGDTRFDDPVRLSSARSPGPVAFGGDDNAHVALSRDTLFASWGDQRGGPAPAGWFGSDTNHVGTFRFIEPGRGSEQSDSTRSAPTRTCSSRRTMLVHLRGIRGQRVRRVAVFVNGRRTAARRGPRRTYRLSLRGRPRGIARVRFVITTAAGRTVTDRRTYRLCVRRRR